MTKPAKNAVSETATVDVVPTANVTFEDGTDATNLPPSFETYRAKAREHGADKAKGDDSIALLAIDIVDGAKAKLIDPRTVTDKQKANEADPTDNIETLFDDYTKARGLKAIHERKGNSLSNKTSQLRKFAYLGMLKDVDGPSVIDDVKARYTSTYEKSTTEERKLLNDAFTSYYKAAILQVDNPKVALTDEQIGTCIKKAPIDPKKKNVATQWAKIAKQAKSLTDGTFKLPDGTVVEDKSPAGQDLAAKITAHAKLLSDMIELAESKARTAEIEANLVSMNGGTV